jgi:hypothetical protein
VDTAATGWRDLAVMANDSGPCALSFDSLDERRDCVEARLRVSDPRLLRTSAYSGLVEGVLRVLPGLSRHRCECGSSHGIEAELCDTELAHLVEHVALELMAEWGAPRTLRGETHWDFKRDGRGVFRVRVAHDAAAGAPPDLAHTAVLEAVKLVNSMIETGHSSTVS